MKAGGRKQRQLEPTALVPFGFVDKIPKHDETESGETCSTTVTGWLAMVRLVETLEGLARVAP